MASKEALREKAALELATAQRDAKEAEQRHIVHERRLLADVDPSEATRSIVRLPPGTQMK
ncbi:hypothetical protein [Variovorax sp. RA8]|uniref:hypothetical protein n=1 Tax=Variovorax sp. (strain JCM 16519 / RA8) TaxID=662548 RepID=UPI0013A55981|nr:hypothetical protein [Variovorax sp. RA8]